jgi:hypothetical protein
LGSAITKAMVKGYQEIYQDRIILCTVKHYTLAVVLQKQEEITIQFMKRDKNVQ